jgi:pimeloyl-ACP methyl ester carboxylesterase
MVARITAPKLFLASEGDSSAVASAQQYFALAQEPKEIKIFPGSAHGTDILKGAQGLEVQKTILEFVAR